MEEKDKKNKNVAHLLRSNMTICEKKLWYQFLKKYKLRFRRQQRIKGYVVDFYCRAAKMVIELDGVGHEEEESVKRDRQRDKTLEEMGLCVLRFSNYDVLNEFEAVCNTINSVACERAQIKNDFEN